MIPNTLYEAIWLIIWTMVLLLGIPWIVYASVRGAVYGYYLSYEQFAKRIVTQQGESNGNKSQR